MIEEVDGFEFFAKLHFLLGRNVLEGCAVGAEVKSDELHDALSAHDIATEVNDDVDDILCVVLQFASLLEVACRPCFLYGYEATAVVVGGASNAPLCTAHGEAWKDGLVLTMEHIELSVFITAASVVLIEALEGIFDAGEVGDATIDSTEEVVHGEERAVEGGDMVEIEGQLWCSTGDFLAIFCEFLDTANLREGRCHGTDSESSDSLIVLGKFTAAAHTGAADMHDDFEVVQRLCSVHPSLCDLLALVLGQHIAFAAGTIDKHAFKSVAMQQSCVFGDDGEIDTAIGVHRSEGGINEALDFLELHRFSVFS